MKIKPINIDATVAVKQIQNELPFLHGVYNNVIELHNDINEWVAFYINDPKNVSIYAVDSTSSENMLETFNKTYAAMESALDVLFSLPDNEISYWMECSATYNPAKFSRFIEYAKYSWQHKKRRAVYGRFDAACNPETGDIEGIYEFNGDTPVMLFESVNLENLIVTDQGASESQENNWWNAFQENFSDFKNKTVAIVCDINYVEDTSTCETLCQAFESVGAHVYLTTLQGFNHDLLSIAKPFYVDGVQSPVDAAFVLVPWEEMLDSGNDILLHWQSWVDNVELFEPPWRWFMSNKGFLAFITYLLENDDVYSNKYNSLPFIPTYKTVNNMTSYVRKPVIGRLSQNITIVDGVLPTEPETHGAYANETMIYQEYRKPYSLKDRGNFIVGAWINGRKAETLCFREFDTSVLDLKNERFVAHLLI